MLNDSTVLHDYLPGDPYPLGATWNGHGVNFSLYTENATVVELCLFENTNSKTPKKIRLIERTHHIWHIYIPDLKPGQLYAYKIDGPFDPLNGHRFNAHKLLLDPYAKAIAGNIQWNDALFGYEIGNENKDLSFSETDSSPYLPKCVVINPDFDWGHDSPLKIPYHKTIIYEMHVRGFTMLHPEIPENLRGTYAGISHPVCIDHLKKLGITTVEIMPVHFFVADRHLVEKGLTNYWGYNSIGFFAPEVFYSSNDVLGEQVNEFKNMVKTLHESKIEVIMDVVYNHTAEGNELGPLLSFKGLDNVNYYRLAEDKRFYFDYTGTGNTLNANLPNVLRLMMDSLRYWILEMHVDGFRFDLASTLARELHEVNKLSAFFDIIQQDPVISQVKLIAEPWDIGEGGYQVGKFPPGWAEWNGKYRDCLRDYWRGTENMLAEFALRFTGSPDLYQEDYRSPTASINFITAHDGFTLHDLVSYNEKHNEANGENNTDGESNNRSWNCGEEGVTNNANIIALRQRQKRNLLTSLFISQGVPMLLAGDELGNTQHGNNNVYCQNNEMSWVKWQDADNSLLSFTQFLIKLRRDHPIFSRGKWFKGKESDQLGMEDIAWFLPDGNEMSETDWNDASKKSIGIFLNGGRIRLPGWQGENIEDDSFYIIVNAHHEVVKFTMPEKKYASAWRIILNTATGETGEGKIQAFKETLSVEPRCILIFMNKLVKPGKHHR